MSSAYECAVEFVQSLIHEANEQGEKILRFNPNHDPENGRFTSDESGGKGVDISGESGIIYTNKQVGRKFGKHCADWGLDASASKDRAKLKAIINDIVLNPDETRTGKWSGQAQDVLFYVKSGDLVILKQNKEFVSVMRGGSSSARFKNARKHEVR